MNKKSIVFLTKDAFCADYIPCYGNKYWAGKTPNFDELAQKGTVFTRFYTAAPSSAMSYRSMFSGLYPHQDCIKTYGPVPPCETETLFDYARNRGFVCHVMWDDLWMNYLDYVKCYGEETSFHPINGLRQGVGFHYQHEGFLVPSKEKELATLKKVEDEMRVLCKSDQKIFLWFHVPHVLNGRVCMGEDMDMHDAILGIIRKHFDDSCIYVSADHGNMNGMRGKLGYGFDVYEQAIRIPLITPRKKGMAVCNDLVSNIDIRHILFDEDCIPSRDIIYSDCAYYTQPQRKLAILWKNYRYIYNKPDRSEELYDIDWDPNQNFNLIPDATYDVDRHVYDISRELYLYPHWNILPSIIENFRAEKNAIWKDLPPYELFLQKTWNHINSVPLISSVLRPFKKILLKIFLRDGK